MSELSAYDPRRVAAVRAVMAQVVDVASMGDEQVMALAVSSAGWADMDIPEVRDAPLEPSFLPPLDLASTGNLIALEAELHHALNGEL